MIHQSIEEFSQYGVITTTKIIREKEMTMPAITFCSDLNSRDMIMLCHFERDPNKCKMVDLTLYDELGAKHKCVQINHGSNVTELVKTVGEGDAWLHGYGILVYMPPNLCFDLVSPTTALKWFSKICTTIIFTQDKKLK